MKDNKMGNIWQALIKYILHIFVEKSLKYSNSQKSNIPFYLLQYDSGIGDGSLSQQLC